MEEKNERTIKRRSEITIETTSVITIRRVSIAKPINGEVDLSQSETAVAECLGLPAAMDPNDGEGR